MLSKTNIFLKGFLDVLPLLIPVAPFGIILGVIGIELGFSPLVVYATSFIVFSGSAQIVLFQLISAGATPIVTLTTVAVTNSRHFLYGAVVSEYFEELNINDNVTSAIITPDKDIVPDSNNLSPAYIVFDNYELILKWNRSLRFALAVCTLKDKFSNEL